MFVSTRLLKVANLQAYRRTEIFTGIQKYPLSFPYFCMPVNHGLVLFSSSAVVMRCYPRLLDISYKGHVTNKPWEVQRKMQATIDKLLTLV